MKAVQELAGWLPSGHLKRICRDFVETELRGFPRTLLQYRDSQLSLSLDMVLAHYCANRPQVCFVQVGAFDGISGDPIYPLIEKYGLRGILVEPQRDAFERLKITYSSFDPSRFVLVNAAIAAHDGTAFLYRTKPGSPGPDWLPQIASLDLNVIMSHAHVVPKLASFIEREEVRCITFEHLFREAGIPRVDLLQVDAEGYDAEIVRLFDVPSRRPAIIHFEHKHLSPTDHGRAVSALVQLKYRFALCGESTLAYLIPEPDVRDRLTLASTDFSGREAKTI
jgi:FkbM family methyltransferase